MYTNSPLTCLVDSYNWQCPWPWLPWRLLRNLMTSLVPMLASSSDCCLRLSLCLCVCECFSFPVHLVCLCDWWQACVYHVYIYVCMLFFLISSPNRLEQSFSSRFIVDISLHRWRPQMVVTQTEKSFMRISEMRRPRVIWMLSWAGETKLMKRSSHMLCARLRNIHKFTSWSVWFRAYLHQILLASQVTQLCTSRSGKMRV